ncbi:hypothetical protein GH714_008342 [Hevea brasiliensis]|uniref:EF-hand domain-containing protein n=1 Tax=Hevea brasiliensis TaxID=3981 RepID=A0A6A6LT41_HEVBR|nr:hypothetical protein GH714_008342 [Hevea brasiliensis]
MMNVSGLCSRLVGELVQAMGVAGSSSPCLDPSPSYNPQNAPQVDDFMIRALTVVFGMENNVPVEEVLNGLEKGPERQHLLHEAFKIFDEDGNGYIEAVELKRVLQCLGLDKGWDMSDIEKMLKVVDLNLDGRIDFSEFELMMSQFNFLFSLNCIFFPNNRWVLITCSPSLTSFNQLTFNLPKLQSQ